MHLSLIIFGSNRFPEFEEMEISTVAPLRGTHTDALEFTLYTHFLIQCVYFFFMLHIAKGRGTSNVHGNWFFTTAKEKGAVFL